MKSCPECLKALQKVRHQDYTEKCIGCAVRKLAYMSAESREQYLDRLQHLCGYQQRAEVARMVVEEQARIAVLKGRK